jgi:serine/threonine-protein phosphatase Stp1
MRTGVWRSVARTDPGKSRARNEDAFLDDPKKGLWVVADGMGGYQGGDIASRLIVAGLAELPQHNDFEGRVKGVRQCLLWLNRRLSQELTVAAGRLDDIIGSTVVTLLIEGSRAVCIWAGDSRCYLWREQRLYQLTRDHSLRQQLIDEHQMDHQQAWAQPHSAALTRAVGASEQLTLDVLEFVVHPADAFLLCSDGLYQGLSSETLGRALNLPAPEAALTRLFEDVLCGAARDNLTGVVIRQ